MICCDECEAWQHNECMEISEDSAELPEQYFCEQCRPQDHKALLAKIARGEKPWEERARQREREEAERKGKKRKGKKGKKGRASEAKKDEPQSNGATVTAVTTPPTAPAAPVAISPAQPETPKAETGQKRKLEVETSSATKEVKHPVSSAPLIAYTVFTNMCRSHKANYARSRVRLILNPLLCRDARTLLQAQPPMSDRLFQNAGRHKELFCKLNLWRALTRCRANQGRELLML